MDRKGNDLQLLTGDASFGRTEVCQKVGVNVNTSSGLSIGQRSTHIGGLYFLNGKGDVLLYRLYRDDVDTKLAIAFRKTMFERQRVQGWNQVTCYAGSNESPPVQLQGNTAMVHYRAGPDVYLLALTSSRGNCMMITHFLSKFVQLIKSYCNGKITEDIVKGNFVLIYELLDDVLDHGYPQLTDPVVTKSFIFQKSTGFGTESKKKKKQAEAQSATLQVTGAVGWRKQGIKYKKNEMYLDMIENVNVLMGAQGAILRADVQGSIQCKSQLSGMPEVKIGLNDVILRENITFHPCVNLSKYHSEGNITFIPPDGEFEVARYRVAEGIDVPFKATALVTEQGRTRLDVTVKVRSTFLPKLFAANVRILVPTPRNTARAICNVSVGKAKYDPRRGGLIWKITKFAGNNEHTLAASVELLSTANIQDGPRVAGQGQAGLNTSSKTSGAPLALGFRIPMHSVSGVDVKYLKVWDKSGYSTGKWIRKTCVSGDYQIRL